MINISTFVIRCGGMSRLHNTLHWVRSIFFPRQYKPAEVYSAETVSRLMTMLDNADSVKRRNGCVALSIIVDEWPESLTFVSADSTVNALHQLTEDSDKNTREAASRILKKISEYGKKNNPL